METFFPQLLTYGFFAPLILRTCVALIFLFNAKKGWVGEKRRIIQAGVALILGIFLFIGSLVQLAAVAGLIYILVIRLKKSDSVFSTPTSILAASILLSLLLTGAGFPLFPWGDKPY